MDRFASRWLRVLLVLSTGLLMGAAGDFPEFQMEEYEEALNEEEYFFEEPELIPVPRVSDRLYGEGELNRFPVVGVVIEGVVPYPNQNITQDQIQALIDQRFQEEQATLTDENGFTERDLKDIGEYLREIIDRPGRPDIDDLRALEELVERVEFQRGWITIEQLDQIALAVTEYYRENGFILATAFVPEQEVSDGIVRLNVLEGRLGDVAVSNELIFSPDTIKAAFNNELGEPVTEERIEGALRRINDLPGVRVRGSFSPGDNVGETRLTLGVLEEKAWSSSVVVDNHGSETTGETRLYATTEWHNLFGRGHRLLAGVLRSEGPDSSLYGQLEYEMPWTSDHRGTVKAAISTNEFSVTRLANLPEIVGETDNYGLGLSYQVIRSRTLNLGLSAGYTQKDVIFQVGDLITLSTEEKIEVVNVSADYTQLWDDRQLLLTGRFGIDQGHMIEGEARGQSVDFTKFLLSANLLKRFSINNWLTKNESYFNFVVKLNTQYTEKFLSSVEQFSLGGPNAVRSLGVSDVSVDSGAYAGMELFFDLPWDFTTEFDLPIDPIRPYVFYDYAYGVARGLEGGAGRDFDAKVHGYGAGFRVNWPNRLTANVVFARPRSATYQDDFLEEEGESRFFVDLVYYIR
ncbi:MAG: ShlB/FhaC/HecB family hemolysin secretion/activation protein [Pseudomonadales bacterium]|nr:ShlB/FhaC/HecB family hemolysin secretion/activation protein [Pseudomonadales bacterium]MBO6597621.1 ShlB/FhaC/HecB family hemolysin secretion/activation protein [Pseudomonadales bacterium]MBO6823859.1 ShlB/FhaC/HecB family hemolysin secretion/activation protein [Pseudomonadales bacterium]